MITVKNDKITLELYSGIKQIPIIRHKLMQQYLLQESGIGSSIADIDNHLAKTISLLQGQKYDDAKDELANLRYNFFTAITNLDFKTRAFACLICRVNGELFTDTTPEGLSAVVKLIEESGMTNEDIEGHWDSIKKKLIQNSEHSSPDGSDLTLSTLKT